MRKYIWLPLAVFTLALAQSASATTYTVTSLADDGSPGTLRWAFAQTQPASDDVIDLTGLEGTITLAQGEITKDIANVRVAGAYGSLRVLGPGADRLTIDAHGASRIFHFTASSSGEVHFEMSGLALTRGVAPRDGTAALGGALLYDGRSNFDQGDLTLDAMSVTQSHAGDGASQGLGGGIYVATTSGPFRPRISNSFFAHNTAGGDTTEPNVAGAGFGRGGALYMQGAQPEVINSTFVSNRAGGDVGGGISVANGRGLGGAIYLINTRTVPASVRASSFLDNDAGSLPGSTGTALRAGDNDLVQVAASVFEANGPGTCSGSLAIASSALSDDASCAGATAGQALLEAPALNGGSTPTLALGDGSDALDLVEAADCEPTDQRGLPRPDFGRPRCDAGAFERQTRRSTMTELTCSPAAVLLGQTSTCTATVTDTDEGIASTPTGSVDVGSASCVLSAAMCSAPFSSSVVGPNTVTGSYGGDESHAASSGGTTVTVGWPFRGFFSPVDNLPTVNVAKAGSAIPVSFSLGGNRGLGIFASPPASTAGDCGEAAADGLELTASPGASGLSYDSGSDRYQFVWKTDKAWRGCRTLVLRFADGTSQRALFRFR